MTAPSLTRSFLLAAGMTLLLLTAARAEDAQTFAFSDPGKPGTLKIRVGHGDVVIHGADTKEISITSDSKPDNVKNKDGLRVIASRDSYNLSENNNVATLSYGLQGGGHDSDFKITVPRNTCVVVANSWGGDTAVYDVSGDIEVRSMNGDVKLVNVHAGASIETMNGEISATLAEMQQGHAVSLISQNGEVHVRVPDSAKANIRFRTFNGTILTDFDENALVTKTEQVATKNIHVEKPEKPEQPEKMDKDSDDDADSADWKQQVHDAMREANRQIAEAGRQAAIAGREAAMAAKQAAEAFKSGMEDPNAPMPPLPPIPPVVGGKTIVGTLNGGGPDLQISTMSGDIVLRKVGAKPAPSPAPATQK